MNPPNASLAVQIETDDQSLQESPSRSLPTENVDLVTWYYQEAERMAYDGEVERARTTLRHLMSVQPDHGAAHLLLARLDLVAQRWAQALGEMKEARRCGEPVPEELEAVATRRLYEEREALYAAPAPARWYVGSQFDIRGRTMHVHGLDSEDRVDRVVRMVWKRFAEIDEVHVHDAGGVLLVRKTRPV